MENKLKTASMLKIAALTACLFSQVASATTAAKLDDTVTTQTNESHLVEEIKAGFADLLADLGFPEVKHQVKKQLQHNTTEQHASELVSAATAQLPVYKFKVVIAD